MTDAAPDVLPEAAPLLRPVRPADVPAILTLIRELADYEREPDAVLTTEEQLHEVLFGERPAAFGHVVEHPGADGPEVAAFAIWFLNFSTWTGRHGVYLEDLYVRPAHRGRGYGQALLRELARVCVERGYGRLEWSCLRWNTPARGFYASIGAQAMEEWLPYRVDGEALQRLAAAPGRPLEG